VGPTPAVSQGYFSVLRYRSDPTRDEARNLAVVVVDERGQYAGLQAAPISQISPNLHEQGLVDSLLSSISRQALREGRLVLQDLIRWSDQAPESLVVTPPAPTALLAEPSETLAALYKAFVLPRASRSGGMTKGQVIDQVVRQFRSRGAEVRRGTYVGDYLFDVAIDDPHSGLILVSCISFDRTIKDWVPVEKDAAHFLYGRTRVPNAESLAVLQVSDKGVPSPAEESFERINRWFEAESVKSVRLAEASELAATMFGDPKQLLLRT
jgi:hypothetical protein